ncbi:A-kinase anchor protein 8-like isoform X4 [Mustela lutreola]|uniref:A-kinase anchor protein 8-like isoform X4 n=1 Tax=Mustela lutreola TaxID=9666 RepID=UPI002797900F|nr:A-kinase anchor protein 8-like isoform X4 [Mustela lutreola]
MSYTGFVQGSETTLQSTYSDTSAQPTCDYGYGTWNSGTNRGYENYGYGYGYGQDNTTNYGYGMATSNSWEMPSSDTNANPSAAGSASADSVLSRINQRLDMVPHLETDMMQGGVYGSGGERYDSYEACDSRAILSERDLYRSGYDYGELDPEMEMAYEGQYDAYRDQFRMRGGDTFGPRAQGWARDSRSGRPMASGYGRMWEDPMGARGQCMPGASRLPSLFSQNIIPEYSMFQGMRGGGTFPGGSRFGFGFGNGMKQMRRTWKTWTTADFRTKKKKRKQCGSPDEPDSKATRTDCSDNSDSDNDEGTEGEAAEGTEGAEAVEKGSRAEGEDEEGKEEGKEDAEKGALSTQDDSGQIKRKLQAGKKSQDKQKKRQRDRMVERPSSQGLTRSLPHCGRLATAGVFDLRPDTARHRCPEAPALGHSAHEPRGALGARCPCGRGPAHQRLEVQGACATPASCQEAAAAPRRDGSTCGLWQPRACPLPCPPALSGRACLQLRPSRPLVGSVCPQGSRTGACLLLLRLRLLLLLDLPQPRRRPAPGLSRQS